MNIHSYTAGWPDSDREREREHPYIYRSSLSTWTSLQAAGLCWFYIAWLEPHVESYSWPCLKRYTMYGTVNIVYFLFLYHIITSHLFQLPVTVLCYYIQTVSLTPSKPTSFKSDFEFIGLACIKHQFRIHVVRLFARRTHSSGFATLRARRDQRADDGVHFFNHCLRRITINIY